MNGFPWRRSPAGAATTIAPRWRVVAAAAVVFTMFVVTAPAGAHATIDVGDGRYVLELGFRDEPTYLGQPNAVFVKVSEYATGGTQPVDGLAATLSTEVSKDGQAIEIPLVPRGDGEYEAPFVPTALGDYTFRVFGTIGDAPVDESVTAGPDTFSPVAPLSQLQFPVPWPDPGQLQQAVTAAQSDLAGARTLAIGGLAAGLLGVAIAVFAVARSSRGKT